MAASHLLTVKIVVRVHGGERERWSFDSTTVVVYDLQA